MIHSNGKSCWFSSDIPKALAPNRDGHAVDFKTDIITMISIYKFHEKKIPF